MLVPDMLDTNLVSCKGFATVSADDRTLVLLVHHPGLVLLDVEPDGVVGLRVAVKCLDLHSISFDSLQS